MQEREKSSTNKLPTRFAVKFFWSHESLKSRKRRIFLPKSYIQGQEVQEARKLWSPPGLVCRHKKGTWERRKEEDQGRREGGSTKARFRVPSTKNFFFFVHEYLGSERPVSFEISAPTRLSLWGSHVRRKFRKRTILRSESSTLKGLLYAGWKSRCEAFVARKGRTIALEQSVSEKAVKDKQQSTFFHKLGILCDSYLGCTA